MGDEFSSEYPPANARSIKYPATGSGLLLGACHDKFTTYVVLSGKVLALDREVKPKSTASKTNFMGEAPP